MSNIVKIGRKSAYHGKRIFEILCNLRHFGENRVVESISKSTSESKTFYIIRKALPQMDPDLMWGRVYAIEYLHGQRVPGVVEMETIYEDYKLIPKHQEDEYLKIALNAPILGKEVPKLPLPKYIKVPPVLAEVINRNKLPKIPCIYIKGLNKEDYGYDAESLIECEIPAIYEFDKLEKLRYRIADDGETPINIRPILPNQVTEKQNS